MEMDNDADYGAMEKIAQGVNSRKRGEPIRVIYDKDMPREMQKRVFERLNVRELDTSLAGGRYQNHRDLMSFPDCGHAELKYEKWQPVMKPEFLSDTSIFDSIRRQDRFIHVPYHSFDAYIRLLREAALRPSVKEIKIGSADWMPRNLVNRIEVMPPVYDEDMKRDLMRTLDYGLRDTANGRIVDRLGTNAIQPVKDGETPFRSQEQLHIIYSQQNNNEQ